jgi:hypothetical protein
MNRNDVRPAVRTVFLLEAGSRIILEGFLAISDRPEQGAIHIQYIAA